VCPSLNSKANPPTLVGGGVWGQRPHTIFIPPTKLVVEWRNVQALSKKSTYRIRSQVSFRVLPEVSVWSPGGKTQEASAGDDQRSVRYVGYRDRERASDGRSCARVLVGAAEVFSGRSDEADQGKQFGEALSGISGAEEALLGTAFLGARIFREHGWGGRRNDQKIYQRAKENRESTQVVGIRSHRRSRWWFTICPTGKVPAIEVDGIKLFESNSINRYLALANNSPVYPQDLKKRAVVDAFMDYVAIHVAHALGRVLFNRVFAPMTGQKADQESIRVGLEFLDKYFPILEKQLSQNPYLAGREFSLADINLLAVLDPCEMAQISLDKYSSITQWRKNLKSQPFYQKCYKDYSQFVQEIVNAKVN